MFALQSKLQTAMICGSFVCVSTGHAQVLPVPTQLSDFFMPGSQPGETIDAMRGADDCKSCHGGYHAEQEPYAPWAASLMGQAMRDPLFLAAMAIAEQDAQFAGDLCLRCHTPGGWVEGRSLPTNGSALVGVDFDGVACHTCHRMVDPVYKSGVSPGVDESILGGLTAPPVHESHSGQFVLDPLDRRRGPFDLGSNFNKHEWLVSPYQQDSMLCVTCHDVSNPVFMRDAATGKYVLDDLGKPHPTQNKVDQFPVERTASEWLMSDFAKGPIDMGGRFGGNKALVSTCQDCHMPDATGQGAKQGATRSDLPQHHFAGGGGWVLNAVRNLHPDTKTHLSAQSVADAIERNEEMLEAASDTEVMLDAPYLEVRVTNQTGHKLPSGYPEGRRLWLNVQFFDETGTIVAERGAYDLSTAILDRSNTKVYEAKIGVDEDISAATGVPVGPGFHFALSNTWYFDNRIPPRGFTNAGFEAVQAAPVAYSYNDGQYWDDTRYRLPLVAARAEVRLFYQASSREYIEFLRDENTTTSDGITVYEQWTLTGKSAPVEMDQVEIQLDWCFADCDPSTGAGVLDIFDFLCFQNNFVNSEPSACDCDTSTGPNICDVFDFLCFQNAFVGGCT